MSKEELLARLRKLRSTDPQVSVVLRELALLAADEESGGGAVAALKAQVDALNDSVQQTLGEFNASLQGIEDGATDTKAQLSAITESTLQQISSLSGEIQAVKERVVILEQPQ